MNKKARNAQRRELEKEHKQKLFTKRIKIAAVAAAVAICLIVGGILFVNSDYARRSFTAVTIDGRDFTVAEFEYFFSSAFIEFQDRIIQTAGGNAEAAMNMLPTPGVSLRRQQFDAETGRTWAEFISDNAISELSQLVLKYNASVKYGYVLSGGAQLEMEDEIKSVRDAAIAVGLSFEEYLRDLYGSSIDEKLYLDILRFVHTARSFNDHMHGSRTYTAEELFEFYEESSHILDNFTYRFLFMRAEGYGVAADFDTRAEFESAQEAALKSTRQRALEIAAGIESENDLIAAAGNHDPITHEHEDSTLRVLPGDWLGGTYGPWMREPERRPGDVSTFDIGTGSFVVYFIMRDNNDYYMPEIRQILIEHEQSQSPDMLSDDDPSDADSGTAVPTARERAGQVYRLFVEGGSTEEALIGLIYEHSDDPAYGGLHKNITKLINLNQMPAEVENWLFDSARQVGDYALIRSDVGYHLVYFRGFGERARDFIAVSRIRERDHNAWLTDLGVAEVNMRWASRLVG